MLPSPRPRIRGDLTYHPDPEQPGHFYIKDPIRREFFHFNELQVAMMKSLDGRRSDEEIVDFLGMDFGIEVPVSKIQAFVERLERELLLDVNSYRVNDARTRRAIARQLRKARLTLRVAARRNDTEEGRLFSLAVHHLNHGDPCEAARYFDEVLAINPKNKRATAMLRCVYQGFFKSKRRTPSHLIMFHLWNPDRFLTRFDARFGRFIYSRFGALVIALILISMLIPMLEVLTQNELLTSLSVTDFVVFEATMLIGYLIHELGHGLSCKHYGGRVDDLGLMIFYGAWLAAYADASDTYLFSERRHKVIVFLSGVISQNLFGALLWLLLALSDPAVPLYNGVLLAVIVQTAFTFLNLVPLAQLDGYYALSDYLGTSNLRGRSFRHLQATLSRTLLGVELDGTEPNQRERRLFLIFGLLSATYSVVLVYVGWISIILPAAVKYLGGLGVIIALIYFAHLLGRVLLLRLFLFLRFVASERATIFTIPRTLAFAAVISATVIGLAFPWSVSVDGEAVIEPHQLVRVRAEEPGLIAELMVEEGEPVSAGQVLAVLESEALTRDHAVSTHDLAIAELELAEMRRGATEEERGVAAARSRTRRVVSAVARDRLRDARQGRELEVDSVAELERARAEASTASKAAAVSSIDAQLVFAGERRERIAEAEARVRELRVRAKDLEARVEHLVIRAPIPGVVVRPRLHEDVGRWLKSGDELCEVHDVSRWRAVIIPHEGEPLGDLAVGQELVLQAFGAPHEQIRTRLERILPPTSKDAVMTLEATIGDDPMWRTGMSGHARIYGPPRSVAYSMIALPIIRIFDYDLWRLIWG